MKKILIYLLVLAFAVSMVVVGTACKEEAAEEAVEEAAEEAVEEAAEEVEEAIEEMEDSEMLLDELAIAEAKKLAEGKDITLNVMITWDPPGTALIGVIPQWEAATGIKIKYEQLSTIEASQKINLELSSGQSEYDMFMYDGYIRKPILENENVLSLDEFNERWPLRFDTMIPGNKESTMNDAGNIKGVPFFWCSFIMTYRKDLFENPDEQAAFKEKYGYELDVHNLTWDKSYKDAAEFFTRDTDGDGEIDLWGTSEMFAPYAAGDTLIARYLNYWTEDKYILSDPETGESTIRDDEMAAAFTDLKEVIDNKWIVPDHLQIDWAAILGSFGSGRSAMAFQYAPSWGPIQAVTQDFPISGPELVGFTQIPGMEGHQRSCQTCSWISHINANSENTEMVYLFLLWASSEKMDKEMAKTTLHNPVRIATYEDPEIFALNPTFEAEFLYPEGFLYIPDHLIFEEEILIISNAMAEMSAGTITEPDEFIEKIATETEAKWAEVGVE